MNYREQLQQEINQAESQLKKPGEVGAVQNEGTEQLEQGNSENSTEEAGNRENAEGEKGTSTGFVKHDNNI